MSKSQLDKFRLFFEYNITEKDVRKKLKPITKEKQL